VDETPDYPGAVWVAAAPGNFRPSDRPSAERPIDMIVIHDIEGTAISAVRWFQNPQARVSSHYVVDGVTGLVYQQVKERDIAYHAGNAQINGRSVGIEHEGYAYRPGFFSRAEYESAARLVRSISNRYQIPRDRTHIIGHFEVPNPRDPTRRGGGSGHTDPGPWWDWDYFMTLVRNDAEAGAQSFPTVLRPGEAVNATVTLMNRGDDPWPAAARGNETPEAIAQREKTLVYLGTWDGQEQGFGPRSAFYGKGWTSPRLLAPVPDTDAAPGAPATFTVPLNGPTTFGTVTERFRLFRVPTAPRTPVPFGPVLTATVRVEPWDITVSAGQADAVSAPGWTAKPSPDGKGTIYWTKMPARQDAPPPPTAIAAWKTKLPTGGAWDVYVRWTPGPNRAPRATYDVPQTDAAPAPPSRPGWSLVMDQRKNGGQWHRLGRFTFGTSAPAVVRLLPEGDGGVVVADAVRFVGPFPADAKGSPAPAVPGAGPRP
jgi:hypothetical protein